MGLPAQFASLVVLALIALGCWGWAQVFWRRWRGKPILTHEPRRPVPWTLLDLWPVLIFIVLQAGATVASQLMGEAMAPADLEPQQVLRNLILQGAMNLMLLAAALGFVVLRAGATLTDLGLSMGAAGRDVKIGAAAFFTLALPVLAMQAALVQWVPSEHPLIMLLRENPNSLLFLASVTLAVVIAPVVEEYFFRVLLQGWLEKVAAPAIPTGEAAKSEVTSGKESEDVWLAEATDPAARAVADNPDEAPLAEAPSHPAADPSSPSAPAALPFWPIVVSAAIFALMHYSHGPDPIPLFFLALGLGYLYRQTHRALPCITVHFLLNGMSMLILWLELTFGPPAGPGP